MSKRSRREKLARRQQQQLEQQKQQEKPMNSATTVTQPSELKQLKQLGLVMSCVLNHKVIATQHRLTWNGGKLNEVWPEVLAFFKWTYDTTKSESQVRLYVHRMTGGWRAWAYPQKAKLGMSAHEINESDGDDYEKTKQQREQFKDEDGWTYWGTVHHHCSAGAFQSSTDQSNEEKQEGIHITVGHMDKNHYDIHFRLYLNGIRLDGFNLCDFWDIGSAITGLPDYARALLKDGADQKLAQWGMGVPPPATKEFPALWKENVIDCTPKSVSTTHGVHQPQFSGPFWCQVNWRSILSRNKGDYNIDRVKAHSEIKQFMAHPQCLIRTIKELLISLDTMQNNLCDEEFELLDICLRNDLLPGQVAEYLIKVILEQEMHDEQRAKEKAERADKPGNGKKLKGVSKIIDAKVLAEEEQERMLIDGGWHGGCGDFGD